MVWAKYGLLFKTATDKTFYWSPTIHLKKKKTKKQIPTDLNFLDVVEMTV